MVKKIVLLSLFSVMSFSLMAENIIKGVVMDYATRQVIDYANIGLTPADQSAPIAGTTTDAKGAFSLRGMKNGKYLLHVSFLGYDEVTKTVEIKNQTIDLGKLYLSESTQNLSEVEVVGQGSGMRFELDKKVFAVDQNIANAGGSASEVLENIPSVDVDQEGNISLRNSESVEIWINGKPAGLTSENRGDILQQMPAESIKEIEVITNPGAKFSPEGTAGIINIVMKKNQKAGCYGSVNANIDYALSKPWNIPPGGRGGLNINFSSGIVSGFANVGYHYRSSQGSSYNDRYTYSPTDTTRLVKDGLTKNYGGGLFLRGGLDFRVTDRSVIGLSGFGMVNAKNDPTNGFFSSHRIQPTHYSLYNVSSFSSPQSEENNETLTREYDRDIDGSGNHPGYNAMIDWRFDIAPKHHLALTAQYFSFEFNQKNIYTQTDINSSSKQQQNNSNHDQRVQLKTDYEWKPTIDSRLEAGWQTDLAWRNTLTDAYDLDSAGNVLNAILPYYNNFHNQEQTHALYLTYGNRFWNKFSVLVGMRSELFRRHIESDYYTTADLLLTTPQDTTYFQLFPSLFLNYDLGKGNELQLNYTRRIDRPRGHQINPRQDMSDSTNITSGNPYLTPQYSSSLELNYLKNWDRHTISAGIFYRFADHVIQNIKYIDASQTTETILRNTFANIGRRHDLGIELVGKNRFLNDKIQLTTTINAYYNRMNPASFTPSLNGQMMPTVIIPEQNIFAFSARMNASFLFTKTFSGQLSARYRSPRVLAQGTTSQNYSIDLGLKKTFLERKLALAINLRDLLDSRSRSNTAYDNTFWQYQKNRWHSRTISLNITYNFGNSKQKKNEKNSNNPADMDNTDMWGQGADE